MKCQLCGELGHYKKTCPTSSLGSSSSSSGVASGLPPRAQNRDNVVLPSNTGIATRLSASRPSNQHAVVGNDKGESEEDSDSDDDEEAAENSDILGAVEEENPSPEVIDLTDLEWDEYTIIHSEQLG